MNSRLFLFGILLLVFVIVGVLAFSNKYFPWTTPLPEFIPPSTEIVVPQQKSQPRSSSPSTHAPAETTREVVYVTWKFVPTTTSPDWVPSTPDEPLTTVVLVLSGAQNEEIVIRAFPGCGWDTRDGKWNNAPEAIITAVCWWAGAGDEISVHQTAVDELTVRRREVDSQSGWGPFTDIKKIKLLRAVSAVPGPLN